MNREKWLFLVVLVIAVVWGFLAVSSSYQAKTLPKGTALSVDVPQVQTFTDLPPEQRVLRLVSGADKLPATVAEAGRTAHVPFSDLERVGAAEIPPPEDLKTPIVFVPFRPFPGVAWYRWFRAPVPAEVGGAAPAAPTEEEAPADEGEDETAGVDEDEIIRSRAKWTFAEREWDYILLNSGQKWYGTISLRQAERDRGLTKYALLLPEGATVSFDFAQIDTASGRVLTTGLMSREKSGIREVGFADTIENRYWARRTLERVAADNVEALLALGRWVMDLADQAAYDRAAGLRLAADTFAEARAAAKTSVDAVLALGEALHRSFRFDEEFALYEGVLAEKPSALLESRKARLMRTLGLRAEELAALDRALTLAPADAQARLRRGEARIAAGLLDEALADFQEAERTGSPEEQVSGREGRARALLVMGRVAEAADALADASDAASLVTRGAALYAQMKFAEAKDCFARAFSADGSSYAAVNGMGLAGTFAASDAAGIEEAVQTLDRARGMNPLNYYLPPLGQAFAEFRRGRYVESIDRLLAAERAEPRDPYVHYALGALYMNSGRPAEARDQCLEAVRLDYRFGDALVGAGTACIELRDWAGARKYLERALTLEERALAGAAGDAVRQGKARDMVILLNYRIGRVCMVSEDLPEKTRFEKAKERFKAVLALDPRHVLSTVALGVIQYREGDVNAALTSLDRARDLTAPGDLRVRIEGAKARIVDAENRRVWRDRFDRPSSKNVGNGWAQAGAGNVQPQIRDQKVQIAGRMNQAGEIWLTRGDKALNEKFLSAQATMSARKSDQIEYRFIIFQRRGAKVGNAAGVARTARGTVAIVELKPAARDYQLTDVKGADGQDLPWPDGDVVVRLDRSDPEQGVFDIYLNGEKVGSVEAGIRRRAGELEFGFNVIANAGEDFEALVDELEIVRYK